MGDHAFTWLGERLISHSGKVLSNHINLPETRNLHLFVLTPACYPHKRCEKQIRNKAIRHASKMHSSQPFSPTNQIEQTFRQAAHSLASKQTSTPLFLILSATNNRNSRILQLRLQKFVNSKSDSLTGSHAHNARCDSLVELWLSQKTCLSKKASMHSTRASYLGLCAWPPVKLSHLRFTNFWSRSWRILLFRLLVAESMRNKGFEVCLLASE